MNAPNLYAFIDQAARIAKGLSTEEQMAANAELFEGFSKVAAAQPDHAWFPTERSADEIATPTEANRTVGFPYTKYMNAVMDVAQSASVLVMSEAEAERHGIPREKWVYLHGSADTYDSDAFSITRRAVRLAHPDTRRYEYPVQVLHRKNLHRSFGMQKAGEQAFAAAGVGPNDMSHYDIYSCFPIAVQTAVQEMGITTNDGTVLTSTGGLPFHVN